jgi:uncharacterized Zn finger protein
MAVTYDPATLARFTEKARKEGIRTAVSSKNPLLFQVSSSVPGQPAYAVRVIDNQSMPVEASCTCKAGQSEIACKHGAAAISAVRLRRARNAGKALRRGYRASDAGRMLRAAKEVAA